MPFLKVSYEQWRKDVTKFIPEKEHDEAFMKESYEKIKIPVRATQKSAGYDFSIPYSWTANACDNDNKKIPRKLLLTGIRWVPSSLTNIDIVLMLYPRSGLANKYGLRLSNSTGVIDADYHNANNEGHIMINIESSAVDQEHTFDAGERVVQGIFLPFLVDESVYDVPTQNRIGGHGSTGV